MTGEPGSARAARDIAAVMAQVGLLPAGDEGYFQRIAARAAGRHRFVLLPDTAAWAGMPAAVRPDLVNVVGILPGRDSTLRQEAVLVDAHYDHLGVGTPVDGDSIYNGADDDASGTVAVLEIGRVLAAGPRLRRTVVFLATTGEEVGLLGMRWYTAHPAVPLARTVANLEIEMIARPDRKAGGAGRAWLTGFERTTLGTELRAAGLPVVPDPRPEQQFYRRSDNIALADLGIPAHTLSTYNLHADYHRPGDELSRVDVTHMTAVIRVAARAVQLLADGPAPEWRAGGRPDEPSP
jgi:hypothetical protein